MVSVSWMTVSVAFVMVSVSWMTVSVGGDCGRGSLSHGRFLMPIHRFRLLLDDHNLASQSRGVSVGVSVSRSVRFSVGVLRRSQRLFTMTHPRIFVFGQTMLVGASGIPRKRSIPTIHPRVFVFGHAGFVVRS